MTPLLVSRFFAYPYPLTFRLSLSFFTIFSFRESRYTFHRQHHYARATTIYGNAHGGHVLLLFFSLWILNGISGKRLEPSDIRRDIVTFGFLIGWKKQPTRKRIVRRSSIRLHLFRALIGVASEACIEEKEKNPSSSMWNTMSACLNFSFPVDRHRREIRTFLYTGYVSLRFMLRIKLLVKYRFFDNTNGEEVEGQRTRESNFSFKENQQFFRETSLKSPPRWSEKCH